MNGPVDFNSIALAEGSTGALMLGNFPGFESYDLDQTREHIARTYCPHHLSLPRRDQRLKAWLNHRSLGQLGVGAMSYGAEVTISKVHDQDFLLLMLPLAGAAEIGVGSRKIECSSRAASVISPQDLASMHWSAECCQLVIEISTAVLEKHVTLMTGRLPSNPIRFAQEMRLDAGGSSWWNYVRLLLDEIAAAGPLHSPHSVAKLETFLIVKLLESHSSNYSDELRPQSTKIAPAHVRRVERYIVDHVVEPLTLEQLVEVSGVSARALFDGFRRFRGQSPMAYLRGVRFDRVRQDLLNAEPNETVTAIACRWGFYQFGRFAGQYRQLFGELPSETIRNRL